MGIGSLAAWHTSQPAPVQLSTETREALLSAGLTNVARALHVLYQHYAPGDFFTVPDVCRTTGVSRMVFDKPGTGALHAYAPTATTETGELGSFFTPDFNYSNVLPSKKNINKGRQAKRYKVPAPDEVAAMMGISGGQH